MMISKKILRLKILAKLEDDNKVRTTCKPCGHQFVNDYEKSDFGLVVKMEGVEIVWQIDWDNTW